MTYSESAADTSCSVDGCGRPAEFVVYLYDYYPDTNVSFYQPDFTCPFLCRSHMEDNEGHARGQRVPRGYVTYPHSNRHFAQGYTMYEPLPGTATPLLAPGGLPTSPGLVAQVSTINDELLAYLALHPELLRNVDPRRFEELVAELFRKQGFSVELTPRTRDGGRDLFALRSDALGKSLYLVECKRYAPSRKVGVEIVRGVYGVVQSDRATKGVIVTTSSFTKDAVAFASPLEYQLSLRDFDVLRDWLARFAGRETEA